MTGQEGKIRKYWEERASACATPAATTRDTHLRELEIETIARELSGLDLPPGSVVVDVGCGDGYSTVRIAERLPDVRLLGLDYSSQMIESARNNLARSVAADRLEFRVADATALISAIGDTRPAAVMTDRVLINLTSFNSQAQVMRQIRDVLPDGGTYIAIENFLSGQNELTNARAAVGLDEIPVRWHNLYFDDEQFARTASELFTQIRFENFASSYYFATRVVYSAACAMRGDEPDYQHEIHRLGPRLPACGNFSPIRLVVMRR
jgi:ubiquinone/menaquinone biosynthesis C-methylase UbiE